MFAYVKFEDGIKQISSVKDIKNFAPKDAKDFNTKVWYKVLWSGETVAPDGEKKITSEHYNAQILNLAETIQQLEEEISSKRQHIHKLEACSSSEDKEDDLEGKLKSNMKTKKKSHKKTKRSADRNILETFCKKRKENHELSAENKVEKLHQLTNETLKKLLREKEEECKELRKLNIRYQKILFEDSNVLDVIKTAVKCSKEAVPQKTSPVERPKESATSVELRKMAPPKISLIHKTCENTTRVTAPPKAIPVNEGASTSNFFSGATSEGGEIENDMDTPKETSDDDVNVDIGNNNVKITNASWEIVKQSKNPSLFTKNLAVAIWGSPSLKNRSTKGMVCNRLKSESEKIPRPKLTPEKMDTIKLALSKWMKEKGFSDDLRRSEIKNVPKRVGEKIADLNRKKCFM